MVNYYSERIIKVLFDLDDTLINHSQAETDAARKFGETFSSLIPEYNEKNFELLWKKVSQYHIKDFLAQRITFDEQRIRRIRDIFQNQKMTKRDSIQYFNEYLIYYEESWSVYSDVIESLEFLKQQNIDIGILSDGSQAQQELKLSKTGILKYFQFVLTSESEGVSKPHPDFFKKAVNMFGANSKEVIYIGDNLEKDAVGSSDAGLSFTPSPE